MSLKSEKCEDFHRFFSNRDSGKPYHRDESLVGSPVMLQPGGFFPVRCRDGIFKISGSCQSGSEGSPTLSACSSRQQLPATNRNNDEEKKKCAAVWHHWINFVVIIISMCKAVVCNQSFQCAIISIFLIIM